MLQLFGEALGLVEVQDVACTDEVLDAECPGVGQEGHEVGEGIEYAALEVHLVKGLKVLYVWLEGPKVFSDCGFDAGEDACGIEEETVVADAFEVSCGEGKGESGVVACYAPKGT